MKVRNRNNNKNVISNYGYGEHGASSSAKYSKNWYVSPGSPEEDITKNLNTLIARSRDLFSSSPLALSAIKTLRTNVIGTGLNLKPKIYHEVLGLTPEEASVWEKKVEYEFSLWADSKDCDAVRRNDFYEIQQVAFMSMLITGDTFVLLPFKERSGDVYGLKISLIESDRVCDPKPEDKTRDISGGVEVNEDGEIIAYHVLRVHPHTKRTTENIQKNKNIWDRIEVRGKDSDKVNILQLCIDERPEQRRGVPLLSPVIEMLKQYKRYTDSEIMAAVLSSYVAFFIESEKDNNVLNEVSLSSESNSSKDNSIDLEPGGIYNLYPGDRQMCF